MIPFHGMSIIRQIHWNRKQIRIIREWGKGRLQWLLKGKRCFWESDEKGHHIVDTLNITELYTLKLLIVYYMNFTSVYREREKKVNLKRKTHWLTYLKLKGSLKSTYLLSFTSPFLLHVYENSFVEECSLFKLLTGAYSKSTS